MAKLTSTTYDGLTIDPLVRAWRAGPAVAARHAATGQIRQHVRGGDRLALEELEKGACAVLLDLCDEDDVTAGP